VSVVDDGAARAKARTAPGPLVAGVVLCTAGVALLVQAVGDWQDSSRELGGPATAPLMVTGLWVAVSLSYLVSALRGRLPKEEETDEGQVRWLTPGLLLAALAVYAVVLKYTVVGYVIATALFFFGSARLLSVRSWREVVVRDAAVAVVLPVVVYLLFTKVLGITLPAGVLPL
jgi:putative tricarboxylic transport membrane protein